MERRLLVGFLVCILLGAGACLVSKQETPTTEINIIIH